MILLTFFMTYKFTTIINKEGRWYVARCVELGVVSQGRSVEEAQENIKEATELYLEKESDVKSFVSSSMPLVTMFEISHV